ncbi:MAG: hypothetical protein HY042_04390 [Spirochaetia bacterium]|nr:hypothetical protein [Spirochaetia bacterium]
MANRPPFLMAMDFILKEATNDELVALKSAVEHRVRGQGGASALDFQAMSRDIMGQFQGKYGIGTDMHRMTRDIVARMIRTYEPGISEAQVSRLLDQMVPDPEKAARGKEADIPRDALLRMVKQFVDFSLGRMKQSEQNELRAAMNDWPTRYWDIFSVRTRGLVAELLREKLSEREFWVELQKGV